MLRLGLFENRNVLVGVFPQLQKILISGFRLAMTSRERQRSGKLKTRSDNDRRIVGNDPDVVDDLLKFRGSFASTMHREIGLLFFFDRAATTEISTLSLPDAPLLDHLIG